MYLDGILAAEQTMDVSSAVTVLDAAYYDKVIFEAYDVADIETVENKDGTTVVTIIFNDMGKFEAAIEDLGFDASFVSVIDEKQVYTVYFDSKMNLILVESKVEGSFVDNEDGVMYYVDVFSTITYTGEADFTALNVNLPAIES